jgi:hypothetical protein
MTHIDSNQGIGKHLQRYRKNIEYCINQRRFRKIAQNTEGDYQHHNK